MDKITAIFSLPPEQNSWAALIEYINVDSSPFAQADTETNQQLSYITNQIDLPDFFSAPQDIWNESLQGLADDIYGYTTSQIYTITKMHLYNADAGNMFAKVVVPWAIPFTNIDDDTYSEVRDDDKVFSVLGNKRNLQFTRKQTSSLIRLIMPKYTRRVEIEDLNRNFWVIGQAIGAASKFLYDDTESPLPKIFGKILDEITQLWENIIYMYASAYYLKQEYYPTKVIYLPLPNRNFTQRKFDNFEIDAAALQDDDYEERCRYLIQKYNKYHLVIVPFVRSGNYDVNFFSEYHLNRILLYDRYKDRIYYARLGNNDVVFKIDSLIQQKIYYSREKNEDSFIYGRPYYKIANIQESEQNYYYGLLRVIPDIQADYINGKFVFSKFQLFGYDAAARQIEGNEKMVLAYNIDIEYSNEQYYATATRIDGPNSQNDVEPTVKNQPFIGYYGELISDRKKTTAPIIKNATFTMVKIGDFLPTDITFDSLTLIEKSTAEPGVDVYDTDTYGIGARYKDFGRGYAYSANTPLKFLAYCDGQFKPTSSVTPNNLKIWGKSYINWLIQNGKLPNNEVQLISTKIGVGYWTGDNGTQWSHGFVSDLFLYNPNEPNDDDKIQHVSKINLFDGYWTTDEQIFSRYGSQWRHLNMKCDNVTIKILDGVKYYSMEGGLLIWWDHNKEIRNIPQNQSDRPYCSLNLQNNKFTYTNHHNGKGYNFTLETDQSDSYGNDCIIVKNNGNYILPCRNCYNHEIDWSTMDENNFAGMNDAWNFYFSD